MSQPAVGSWEVSAHSTLHLMAPVFAPSVPSWIAGAIAERQGFSGSVVGS
jgi:hypothetical protein